MPPGRLRRALRRILEDTSAELRTGARRTEAEARRMVVGDTSAETVVPLATGGILGPVRRRPTLPAPPPPAPGTRRLSDLAERQAVPEQERRRFTSGVTGTLYPMNSMSIDVGRLPVTYVHSGTLPREIATSIPLQSEREPILIEVDEAGRQRLRRRRASEPTASSTPTVAPSAAPPSIPTAWDDPTIRRVRRVVLEDE